MGFKTEPAKTGRPSYHPSLMLKLYVYGYLNRIQSSRRLEREANRNIELMWLLKRLAPDFKTIADFRKNNTEAIILVCREFVQICYKLNLFADAFIAIGGSKFKAVNSRTNNFTRGKIKARLESLNKSIEKYLREISYEDRAESRYSMDKIEKYKAMISSFKEKVRMLNERLSDVESAPGKQISLTDPDARSMQSNGTIKGLIGYNVQSAVDTKHHLIVAHDVTNNGSDRSQLSKISRMSKEAMHVDKLSVVADRGYYKGKEIQSCDDAGISAYVCRPQTSGSQATGLYGKRDFIYVPNEDLYICPAGEKAIYRYTTTEKGLSVKKYWSSACVRCLIKSDCTTGVNRRITRTEYEPALEVMATRLDEKPEVMAIRKSTVEHPFGTIKMWMGSTHFLMKRLSCVSAEMSLHVLAYNLTRVMNMIGSKQLIKAIQA